MVLAGLMGCDQVRSVGTDPGLVAAQKKALERPANRFVVAGLRQYPNGTEIYVLDGESGQLCYFFVASGTGSTPQAAKSDMRGCAGDALAPSY